MNPRLYLCSPNKLRPLTLALIQRIEAVSHCGRSFQVVSATTDTAQDLPLQDIFARNVSLIQSAPYFVAVFKDYGKDLTAEVGMAYAWGKTRVGLNYAALDSDVMSYFALDIIPPDQLETKLLSWLNPV